MSKLALRIRVLFLLVFSSSRPVLDYIYYMPNSTAVAFTWNVFYQVQFWSLQADMFLLTILGSPKTQMKLNLDWDKHSLWSDNMFLLTCWALIDQWACAKDPSGYWAMSDDAFGPIESILWYPTSPLASIHITESISCILCISYNKYISLKASCAFYACLGKSQLYFLLCIPLRQMAVSKS